MGNLFPYQILNTNLDYYIMDEANGAVEEREKKEEAEMEEEPYEEPVEEMPNYSKMEKSLEKCHAGYTWVAPFKRKGNIYVRACCKKMVKRHDGNHRLHL